jgi:hypothetical protein
MPRTLTEIRRNCSGTILFSTALALAAALYGRQILASWAERTDSDLVVLCLVAKTTQSDIAALLAELEKNPSIREARLVEPREVASWVTQALDGAGASATLSSATQLPVTVVVRGRGTVRQPERFAQTLLALKNHPAFERVFFDEAGWRRTAQFDSPAQSLIHAFLLLAILGGLVAGFGSGWTQTRQISLGLSAPGPVLFQNRASETLLAVLRGTLPAVIAWLGVFVILAVWPILPAPGLAAGTHLFTLVATVVLVELSCWCGAAVGRYLA